MDASPDILAAPGETRFGRFGAAVSLVAGGPEWLQRGERTHRMVPGDPSEDATRGEEWSRWMAAAQDGDRAAYERLLRDIVPFIRAVVFRQHRAADGIDEVVQDVLLTVHKVRHTYDPACPFKHWLAMIARRRSIDALRRRSRRHAHEIADDTAYETFADPAANRHLEMRAAAEGLGEALASLPAQQREAVELLKLREMSLAEASKVSGRSVAALKVSVHRAIKSLRKQMVESWRG